MANSDRDIRIVPDRGASTQPVMYFTGADSLSSATIVLRVLNSSTDATLSFEGDVGQLFSITDSTFGPVFSVNDISGIPSIEVLDSGLVKLAEYNGKVQVGGATNNENATSATTGELQVVGGVGVSRDVYVAGGMTVVGTLNAAVIAGSISNSANVGVTNDTASSTAQYLTFVSGTSGNLPIKVDSSALTFVPSTNNLGIGTTNPYSRLSLVSSAATEGLSLFTSAYEAGRQWGHRIWKNDVGGGIPLQIDAQQTTTWYTTIRMSHGQDNNHPALITYYNTQLAMTSGNVGVGITPTNKLHVSGDAKVAGSFVGLRQYQTGDDFRIDFVKAANDTASARFEWNGYSAATTHLIDYFSIGLNDSASAMQTRFQIMQDGRIGLNTTDFSYTASDNTPVIAGLSNNKVFVNGSIQLLGNSDAIVFGRGTSSFLKDEELAFGWGGGWHMTDATYLRVRNNKHVYNEGIYSGSSFRNFTSSYDAPNLFVVHPTDTNWAFGSSSNNSNTYWMQTKYSGANDNNRGFRVLDVASGVVRMAVADKVTAHPNTFYRTFQSYSGSDNGPMKTWDGVLTAGSDSSGANTYTIIETNVPQDSYMMGGFSINWFENYSSTNAKTRIDIAGYWNPTSNGGHIGFEYTSSNPSIVPTIQVGRNIATGKTVFVLTHFSSNYAIVVARDLWLGYSGGDYDYGSGWSILQTGSLAAYSNLVGVVARTALPASTGSGSGLNADLLDGIDSTGFVRSNAATSGYIDINGGTQNAPNDATVYITATNNNDWGLIVNKYNGSATEYGVDIRMGAASAYALRVNGNGVEKMRINGEGQIFSPLYYDINNTAYYGDFASTSNINALQTAGQVVVGGTFSNQAYSSVTNARLMFGGGDSDAIGNYYIGTNLENYGGNYNKLDLRWHTGIRMGAQPGYGGIRFYDTEDLGTQVFAIGKDGSYAQANQSMRAPIFYDLDNTGYYVDPTSTTSLRTVGSWRSDSSSWDGDFSGKIQYHSNHWYIQAADLFIYRNAGGANVFTVNQSGSAVATGDMRAPIFYDSNNTGFYVDPASTTNLNVLNVATLNISGSIPTNTSYLPRLSDRDFADGTLVQTNINYAVTNGDPFVIEITGNSYGQIVPWDIQIQGYIYSDTIINTAGISNGTNISGVRAINYNGNLCFWWPRQSYWNGFTVYVYVPYATFQPNRVTSISNSVQPTTAKQVIFTIYQNYSNYNSTSYDATFNRLYSNTDIRAQLFYDTNDTSYYVDPHSTSYQRSLFLGAHDSGTSEFRFGEDSSGWYGDRWYWDSGYNVYRYSRFAGSDSLIHYHDTRDATRITYGRNIVFDNYGKGIVGTYASTRFQGVFSMGDAYKLPADGTTSGNLYGIAWSYPSAGGAAAELNTHGALILENGSFLAALSGSIRARDDMRAPIFYDKNDTAYYTDPNSTSNLVGLTANTYTRFDLPIRKFNRTAYNSDSNYWTGTVGWGTAVTWDTAWGYGHNGFDIWGSNSGHPQGAGYVHAQGIQSGLHYATTDGSSAYGWQMVGAADATANRYWARGKWGGTTSAWKEFVMYGAGGGGSDLRAPIYYDSDNTAYYGDFASTSNLFDLQISGASNKYLYITPGNGYEAMVRYNGGSGSGWYVGKRISSQVVGTESFHFYSEAAGQTVGGIDTSGNIFARDSVRAPIFYDNNNTGYYVDPASVSNLNNVLMLSAVSNNNNGLRNVMPGGGTYVTSASSVAGAIVITLPETVYPMIRFTVKVYTYDGLPFEINCGGHTSSGFWYNTFAYMSTQNRPALNVRFTYGGGRMYVYIGEIGQSWTYPQVFITDVQVGYTNYEYSRWDDGWTVGFNSTTYNTVSSSHVVYPPTSSSNNSNAAYASIYYDANNTGYYVDPASTSNLNVVNVASSGNTTGAAVGINLNAAGNGYLFGTTGDGANSTVANVKLTSWFGIGFAPSISGQATPQWQNAAWIDVRSGAFSSRNEVTAYSSDQRLKTNFKNIENPIEKVKQIGGYEFDWDVDKCLGLGFKPSNIHEHGVKAQEIQQVVPDAVKVAPFDDDGEGNSKSGEHYLTVKYDRLVPLLIEAIKEQQTTIDSLSKQVEELTTLVQSLINKSN